MRDFLGAFCFRLTYFLIYKKNFILSVRQSAILGSSAAPPLADVKKVRATAEKGNSSARKRGSNRANQTRVGSVHRFSQLSKQTFEVWRKAQSISRSPTKLPEENRGEVVAKFNRLQIVSGKQALSKSATCVKREPRVRRLELPEDRRWLRLRERHECSRPQWNSPHCSWGWNSVFRQHRQFVRYR